MNDRQTSRCLGAGGWWLPTDGWWLLSDGWGVTGDGIDNEHEHSNDDEDELPQCCYGMYECVGGHTNCFCVFFFNGIVGGLGWGCDCRLPLAACRLPFSHSPSLWLRFVMSASFVVMNDVISANNNKNSNTHRFGLTIILPLWLPALCTQYIYCLVIEDTMHSIGGLGKCTLELNSDCQPPDSCNTKHALPQPISYSSITLLARHLQLTT